ncbi:bifunctional DNA primase/polymerase [Ancylobacter sp. 6x-1]|uniref:Bifunctional DNA primase/polymerase n=1 Tax=Ancylobacter crimeensis TaxID=2579147 RepID=A0ABT0D729_9HYPH|nr:bifunctional DNA primase/polymerase [Ancylobacter crimeensis]MCK0195756.1 bifunctional DNA primase/polymerase [Ancylobacter crimeensis]
MITRPSGVVEALRLAALGIPVFPVRSDKAPYVPGGFKSATTDENALRAWWSQWPDAGIGIPTGAASGWLVLDIDRKPGRDGFATLAGLGIPIPADAVQSPTPSGGLHVFFRFAAGVHAPTDAGVLGPGLDRRGDGGYVVYYGADLSQPAVPAPDWLLMPGARHGGAAAAGRMPLGTERAPSADAATFALMSFRPNDLGYDEWRDVTAAFRQSATGIMPDTMARAVFDGWCAGYRANDLRANERLWRSFDKGTSLGWGWMVQRLSPAMRGALVFGHEPPPTIPAPPSAPGPFPASDLAGHPVPERRWLVRDLIPARTVTLLGGDGGTGKSLLAKHRSRRRSRPVPERRRQACQRTAFRTRHRRADRPSQP